MLWGDQGGKTTSPSASGLRCGSSQLVWLDLELFMDLHFLVEHLNLMLFIVALMICVSDLGGQFFFWLSQTH